MFFRKKYVKTSIMNQGDGPHPPPQVVFSSIPHWISTITPWAVRKKVLSKHSAVIHKVVSGEASVYLLINNAIVIYLHKNQCGNWLGCQWRGPCDKVRPEEGRRAPPQKAEGAWELAKKKEGGGQILLTLLGEEVDQFLRAVRVSWC